MSTAHRSTERSEPAAGDCSVDPRVARSRAAVLAAARLLLVEGGPGAVTVDAVVAASGVAKTTIYRHWPSQEALLIAVLRDCAPPVEELVAVAGDLEFVPALRAVIAGAVAMFSDPDWRRVLPAVLALKQRLAGADELEAELHARHLASVSAVLDKGVAAGMLRPGLDPERVMHLIVGPLLMVALVGDDVTPALGDEIVDRFLASEAAALAAVPGA